MVLYDQVVVGLEVGVYIGLVLAPLVTPLPLHVDQGLVQVKYEQFGLALLGKLEVNLLILWELLVIDLHFLFNSVDLQHHFLRELLVDRWQQGRVLHF